jgi:hypothetical protein
MSYINTIIQLLQVGEFVGEHEYIEIAKGKYKLHDRIKPAFKQMLRELYLKKLNKNGGKTDD